jgi:hypothetical protein
MQLPRQAEPVIRSWSSAAVATPSTGVRPQGGDSCDDCYHGCQKLHGHLRVYCCMGCLAAGCNYNTCCAGCCANDCG